MKVAFNRMIRRSAWGGGSQFLTVFHDYLVRMGHEVLDGTRLEAGLDWIIMLDPRDEVGGYGVETITEYKRRFGAKILHRVNDTGVTRGGPDLDHAIMTANQRVADRTVYISEWVKNHFAKSYGHVLRDPHTVITNGCDTSAFHPPAREREACLSVMSRPRYLVTHHWSDNPAKGLDLYAHIDELMESGQDNSFSFTYIGRFPKSYVPKSKRFRIIPPLYGKELGDELRKYDVYVTGARHEACGSHHVEGAACGMPVIFHNDGGGVVEMCSRYGVGIDRVEEFSHAKEVIMNDFGAYCKKAAAADLSAQTMCEKYLRVMTV